MFKSSEIVKQNTELNFSTVNTWKGKKCIEGNVFTCS